MTPYIQFPCPNCQHKLRVKSEYLGRNLRCKYCAHEFPSPEPSNGIVEASPGHQATEADTQAAQQRIASLEAELRSVRDELSLQTAEYTAAAQHFEQAQDELRRLQDQVHQAWTDQRNAAALNQKLLATQAELDELRTQVQTWQARAVEAERLQAESQADTAVVEQPQSTPAGQPRGDSPTREFEAVPRSRLLEKAQSIRAQLEASSAIKEQVDRLSAEVSAAQEAKDRLTGELQTATEDAAQLRARTSELEQSLAEWTAAHTDLSQSLQQGQAQWEGERQTLHRDWQEKHQSHVRDAEQRFEEEKARLEADRRQLQDQLEIAGQTHEQELVSLRGEVERLQQESTALSGERDASLNQVQVLGDEHHRIVAERDEIDARYKEAVERFRADVARLTESWQQSRQQEATTAEQNQALALQVENLRAELDQQRGRETEHLQTITALQQAAESGLTEAATEVERIKNVLAEEQTRAEADRQKWLAQLDAAQRRFDENDRSLQSEVDRLREEVTALQQALEIVGVVGEYSGGAVDGAG
jgi:chromosome segregation ATPase